MAGPNSVLIVDDDRGMLETLGEILELSGFRTTSASSGPEAIDLALRDEFAVAVLDINMPDMNGFETLRELRRLQPGLPVVLMTAYAVQDEASHAESRHAEEILKKPLDIERLLSILAKLAR